MQVLQWASFVFGSISAVCWAYAAFIKIPKTSLFNRNVNDNLSDIIDPLNRQGRWNSWAAASAATSVALQAIDKFVTLIS
jgi:hypothetical protein